MTPSRLAAALRSIATKIDNSGNPSRSLVSQELSNILAAVEKPNLNNEIKTAWRTESGLHDITGSDETAIVDSVITIYENWEPKTVVRPGWGDLSGQEKIDLIGIALNDSLSPDVIERVLKNMGWWY